jgi:hypothetical protein
VLASTGDVLVADVEIVEDRSITIEVLFEAGQSLYERNLAEQFSL